MSGSLPEVLIENRQRAIRYDRNRTSELVLGALPGCHRSIRHPDCPLAVLKRIEIAVLGDREMARVHRQFLGIRGPTDVITFPYGEILVCAGEAQRNALRFGTSVTDEIALYVIHGFLHLAGFEDTKPADARKMGAKQDAIFRAVRETL